MHRVKRMLFLCVVGLMLCTMGISARADGNKNGYSGAYALVLNDYLYTYGAIQTQEAGERFYDSEGLVKEGVIYSGLVDFDRNHDPYLVIFLSDTGYNVVSCHIWKFNGVNADRIAIVDKKMDIGADGAGEFSIGTRGEERLIAYTRYQDDIPVGIEYYTAQNGEFLKFLTQPEKVGTVGVVDFNHYYLHPGVDVSGGNSQLYSFFERLKGDIISTSAYRNALDGISEENRNKMQEVLGNTSCDISSAKTPDAESGKKSGFKEIKSVYALGSEFYYTVFSTEAADFNYAFMRYTGTEDVPFHIIKFRCDSIPQNDLRLKDLKNEYMNNELAGIASKESLIPEGYCVEDVDLEISQEQTPETKNPRDIWKRNIALYVILGICSVLFICLIAVFIKR